MCRSGSAGLGFCFGKELDLQRFPLLIIAVSAGDDRLAAFYALDSPFQGSTRLP